MAVRSGAGTGVVVSLVVFVLTTVFLLVLTIVFYAGKSKETEAKLQSDAALAAYVKPQQRNSDEFRGYEAAARERNESVAQHLNNRYNALMSFVGGDPAGGLEKLKADMARFQVKETDTIRGRMQDMNRDLTARATEIEGLKSQLTSVTEQVAEKDAQLKQAAESRQQLEQGFEQQIAGYREAANEYRQRLEAAIDDYNKAKDTLRANYEGRIGEQQDEIDTLGRELTVLKGKINEFEKARDADRIKASHPAMLVDGRIVDAPGSSDQIYIDRGKKDRIVRGMTFEVYSDVSQIRPHHQTGELPRGKASLQVISVAETTSTCKITRSVPGQPLVKGDVVANAVYDPTYRFKFLIHGKFDIDADGKPTEPEADYLRGLVVEWGGSVVSGDDLPGDLDFLVLGAEPPRPAPPPMDAPATVIKIWSDQNAANEKYNQLFRQAREAQIPVLNANRFFILIGHTDR